MDINVKSRWIDKENSDVVVVTGLLDDLVLFDYCNNAARKSGSRSVKDFLKKFQLLEDAPSVEGLIEAANKLREFQSKDTDEYKTIEDYNYDLWGVIGDVVYELNKYETKIKSE